MVKTDEKCPYCSKPNLIYRPWLKDIICGWCKRIIERREEKPAILKQNIDDQPDFE